MKVAAFPFATAKAFKAHYAQHERGPKLVMGAQAFIKYNLKGES